MSKPWEKYGAKPADTSATAPSNSTAQKPWERYSVPSPDLASTPDSSEVSKTESGLRGAAQGATFGFADELTGAAEGIFKTATEGGKLADNYAQSRDEARAANKAAESANPISYIGGNLAGGAVVSLIPGAGLSSVGTAASGIIKGGGVLAKMARGIVSAGATGGALGVVQGVGSSDGKSTRDIAGDAFEGGAFGGALGGTLGGAGKLLPGVRGSVTNELAEKVWGVTIGGDAAKVASRLAKDPDARNAMVAAANKDSIDQVKRVVASQISSDVANVRREAAQAGAALLARVDDQMANKVARVTDRLDNLYEPAAANMVGETGRHLRSLTTEVRQILTGDNTAVLQMVGEQTGERLITAPNAQVMRDVRDAIKMKLFKQGNPDLGLASGLSDTEAKAMKSMLAEVQGAFKSIPDAARADRLYNAAASYAETVEQKLIRNGEPSAAAIESWVLGKGTAGSVEDKDNMFALRDIAMRELRQAGVSTRSFGKGAIAKARSIQEFNRLGAGETTGKSTMPAIVGGTLATLVGAKSAGLGAALAMAAYQPRTYLRALAMAENVTADDKRLMLAVLRSLRLEANDKGKSFVDRE